MPGVMNDLNPWQPPHPPLLLGDTNNKLTNHKELPWDDTIRPRLNRLNIRVTSATSKQATPPIESDVCSVEPWQEDRHKQHWHGARRSSSRSKEALTPDPWRAGVDPGCLPSFIAPQKPTRSWHGARKLTRLERTRTCRSNACQIHSTRAASLNIDNNWRVLI